MRRSTPLVALAAVLALTACGTAQQAPTGAEPITPLPGTSANSPTAPPSATPTTLPALASRETFEDGRPLTVAVNTLRVEGATLTLNFTVTNRSESTFFTWENFNSGGREDYTVSGVYVVDGARGNRHLPARDANGGCVCSHTLGHSIEPHQSTTFSAVFAALPEGVDTASVYVPTAGLFEDVPVGR